MPKRSKPAIPSNIERFKDADANMFHVFLTDRIDRPTYPKWRKHPDS
jgi:hypothetical protein